MQQGNAMASIELAAVKIRHALEAYDVAGSAEEKNELLKSVIERIEYSKSIRGNQHIDANQFEITLYPKIF